MRMGCESWQLLAGGSPETITPVIMRIFSNPSIMKHGIEFGRAEIEERLTVAGHPAEDRHGGTGASLWSETDSPLSKRK